MDHVAALGQLNGYGELVAQAQKLPAFSRERRAVMKTVNERVATVNKILRTRAPDIKLISAHWLGDHVRALPRVYQALALLRGWGEMASHEWTGGGPALPLSVLDPVVADAAMPLFQAKSRELRGAEMSDTDRKLTAGLHRLLGRRSIPLVVGYDRRVGFHLVLREDSDDDIIRRPG